jgi:hypothetical protein
LGQNNHRVIATETASFRMALRVVAIAQILSVLRSASGYEPEVNSEGRAG